MRKKAIIAMSGGVDSSVAAYIMKNNGYECIGATIKLFDKGNSLEDDNTCCSSKDIEDAKSTANGLGMPYYVYTCTDDFEEKVISEFVRAYQNGRTPNPCVECNRHIKFKHLLAKAQELGYDFVVTGHYARVVYDEKLGRYLLKKGIDETKDQSYVLYSLSQNQLAHILFPLGELSKARVREIAEENGFVNAGKRDSQDICFVPDGDYASFISRHTKTENKSGNFVDTGGKVLGRHQGIVRYTIGQRKGLGISFGRTLYVCKTCPDTNEVVLGDEENLFSRECIAKNINLIAYDEIKEPLKVKAKLRYKHPEQPATVYKIDDDTLKIVFDKPQRAITPGQSVVLYEGDVVVGGGTIC